MRLADALFTLAAQALIGFFIIGAIGLWFVNKKKSATDKKEAWLKYLLYLIIVWPMLFMYQSAWGSVQVITAVHSLIALIGLYEVISVSRKKIALLITAIIIYLPIAIAFVLSANTWMVFTMIYYSVVIFDGFSQLTGQLIGGPKILPRISPKKTLGGLIGGVVITTCSIHFILQMPLSISTIALFCIPPFVGDVLSSLLKRRAGVKDFNNLIPGHGGVLDRFDSFMFTIASFYFIHFLTQSL